MDNNIIYIATSKLHPHPQNPRKDVGDVTELAESIKANGILQNLTVVPNTNGADGYIVIIGHRRLAAAKLAGIEQLPCAIVEMTHKQQLHTMLTENMQRSDLTVYEQAQGFQLMLEMGSTVDELAKESGFSSTTIRRRVKLLELDQDKLKAASERGATLADYAELDKLTDTARKNKVLETIGTPNYRNKLLYELEDERRDENLAKLQETAKSFAEEIERSYGAGMAGKVIATGERVELDYVRYYNRNNADMTVPDDADTNKYYYTVAKGYGMSLYRKKAEAEKSPEELEEEAKRAAAKEKQKRLEAEAEAITARHAELRRDFVRNISPAKVQQHRAAVAKYASMQMAKVAGAWSIGNVDADDLSKYLGEEIDSVADWIDRQASTAPEKTQLTILCVLYEKARAKYRDYHYITSHEMQVVYDDSPTLNTLYDLLIALGYQVSDEEQAMRDGTHRLFEQN